MALALFYSQGFLNELALDASALPGSHTAPVARKG